MKTTTRRRRLDLEAYYGRTLPKFCSRFEVTDNGALRLLHRVSLRSLWCSATETMVILAATILLPSTTTTAEWNSRLEFVEYMMDSAYFVRRNEILGGGLR
ncbi:unnamed protein product [Brassica rapa subsp. narinosa]